MGRSSPQGAVRASAEKPRRKLRQGWQRILDVAEEFTRYGLKCIANRRNGLRVLGPWEVEVWQGEGLPPGAMLWGAYREARRRSLAGMEGRAPLGVVLLRLESGKMELEGDEWWSRYRVDAMSLVTERVAVLPLRVLLRLIRASGSVASEFQLPPPEESLTNLEAGWTGYQFSQGVWKKGKPSRRDKRLGRERKAREWSIPPPK